MTLKIILFVLYIPVKPILSATLDLVDCGLDEDSQVFEGDVDIDQYPWLGVLYYTYYGETGETRAVTTVALIQSEFVIGIASDIGPMPKHNFRRNARVLLGEFWSSPGEKVRNYVLHPDYGETKLTLALIHLAKPVSSEKLKPLCPPQAVIRNPNFYVMKFKEDYNKLQKEVVPMTHVPAKICSDFYTIANLTTRDCVASRMTCTVALNSHSACVWSAGAALVSKDVWGRWQLLGLGLRGPGCGAPSRYLDMLAYYPWVEASLAQFRRLTISKIDGHKYVLRSGINSFQRYGSCDPEEQINLLYHENIILRTDNGHYQFIHYNLTITGEMAFTCLTIQLMNASSATEMRVTHKCGRETYGPPCYKYQGSSFDISVTIMFAEKCLFNMIAWGYFVNMTLLHIQHWKWEEGDYYDDFNIQKVEYRGPSYQTNFGFEPVDQTIWVPEFDVWTSTFAAEASTTEPFGMQDEIEDQFTEANEYKYETTDAGETTTILTRSTRAHRTRNMTRPSTTTRTLATETVITTTTSAESTESTTRSRISTTTQPPTSSELDWTYSSEVSDESDPFHDSSDSDYDHYPHVKD